jgi:hypothetical protein
VDFALNFNMKLPLLVLVFGIAAASCKKNDCPDPMVENIDTSPDTIFPHSYFPAYPGTWWKYSDSSLIEVESELFPVDYKSSNVNLPCPEINITTHYVPLIGDTAIEFNYRYQYTGSEPWRKIQMFSVTGEEYWETEGSTPYKFWQLDSSASITVQSTLYNEVKIIRMEQWARHSGGYDIMTYVDTTYYADSIGIIKSIRHKTYPSIEFVHDQELVDYEINF